MDAHKERERGRKKGERQWEREGDPQRERETERERKRQLRLSLSEGKDLSGNGRCSLRPGWGSVVWDLEPESGDMSLLLAA